jgi:hypothetical protein
MAFATADDLATFMGTTKVNLPAEAERMLARAELILNTICSQPKDPVTNDVYVTDEEYAANMKIAVCLQCEYWIESDMWSGVVSISTSFSINSVKVGNIPIISPLAFALVVQQGYVYRGAGMV